MIYSKKNSVTNHFIRVRVDDRDCKEEVSKASKKARHIDIYDIKSFPPSILYFVLYCIDRQNSPAHPQHTERADIVFTLVRGTASWLYVGITATDVSSLLQQIFFFPVDEWIKLSSYDTYSLSRSRDEAKTPRRRRRNDWISAFASTLSQRRRFESSDSWRSNLETCRLFIAERIFPARGLHRWSFKRITFSYRVFQQILTVMPNFSLWIKTPEIFELEFYMSDLYIIYKSVIFYIIFFAQHVYIHIFYNYLWLI